MSAGPELFYESWEEALKDDIKALGGTKAVGKMLWPDLDIDLARNRLNDRLNTDRRERLSDTQERMIMRRSREARGFSAAMFYLVDDTGFERPKSRAPRDEMTELQRQFVDSVKQQAKIVERIEHLQPQLVRAA
jgi:hypothetical protein